MNKRKETMPEWADSFPILQFFAFDHLPENVQEVSRLFFEAAHQMVGYTFAEQKNPQEVAAMLRHLLEAKDCAVRAAL